VAMGPCTGGTETRPHRPEGVGQMWIPYWRRSVIRFRRNLSDISFGLFNVFHNAVNRWESSPRIGPPRRQALMLSCAHQNLKEESVRTAEKNSTRREAIESRTFAVQQNAKMAAALTTIAAS
jgi:hypothetical protein